MRKLLVTSGAVTVMGVVLAIPAVASAHVVVKPAQTTVGTYQTFQTAVPNEKENNPTVGLKLLIPAGLDYVQPNVKPGWTINIVNKADAVTEIDWTGGSIPSGQRDEFDFAAQAPAKATDLHWKAYQTYADGTVVAWDQTPDGKDSENSTPYSVTKVINDLAATPQTTHKSASNTVWPLVLSLAALAVSVAGLAFRKRA